MKILSENIVLPDETAIQKIIELVGDSPEVLQYFYDQYKDILDKKHAPSELLAKLNEFYALSRCKLAELPSSAIWNGEQPVTSEQNFLENVSVEALKDLDPEVAKDIQLHLALEEEDAHILRGYSFQEEDLSDSDLAAMDKSFNAWLLTIGVKSRDSVLYICDEEGNIRHDKYGNIKAEIDKVKTVLQDKNHGFAAYMNKKGITVTVFEHPYPTQAAKTTPAAKTKEIAEELKAERKQAKAAREAKDTGPAEPGL